MKRMLGFCPCGCCCCWAEAGTLAIVAQVHNTTRAPQRALDRLMVCFLNVGCRCSGRSLHPTPPAGRLSLHDPFRIAFLEIGWTPRARQVGRNSWDALCAFGGLRRDGGDAVKSDLRGARLRADRGTDRKGVGLGAGIRGRHGTCAPDCGSHPCEPECCRGLLAECRAILSGEASEFDETVAHRDLRHRQSGRCATQFSADRVQSFVVKKAARWTTVHHTKREAYHPGANRSFFVDI